MKRLNIRKTVLNEEGLIAIASCAQHIEVLTMDSFDNKNISIKGKETLFNIICNRREPVSSLNHYRKLHTVLTE